MDPLRDDAVAETRQWGGGDFTEDFKQPQTKRVLAVLRNESQLEASGWQPCKSH